MQNLRTVLIILFMVLLLPWTVVSAQNASFYVATDRSFGEKEIPSINLEGPGDREYEFRVYEIGNPAEFLVKQVRQRLVTEKNDSAYGNAIVVFKQGLQYLKKDIRTMARKELNYKTRSHAKKASGVDLESPDTVYDPVIASLIRDHRFVFTFSIPRQKDQWNYRKIKVPIKNNGVYLVEVVSGNAIGYTLVVKSGLNFLTKQADSQTMVWVARRDTGEPVKGAAINLYNAETGTVLQGDKTSTDGTSRFNYKSPAHSLVIVQKDGEFGISDPDFFAKSFYGEGGIRVYMYTERPVYRPGDTVYFRGIVRNFLRDSYRAAGGAGTVSVQDSSGSVIIQDVPVSFNGGIGTFDGQVILPKDEDINLGKYNLILSHNNSRYSCEFGVEAYRKPTFLVKVSTPQDMYCGGETLKVNVSARYYYGNPVAGGEINCQVFRRKKYDFSPVGSVPFFSDISEYLGMNRDSRNELVAEKKGKLANNGTYSFSMDTDDLNDDYMYSVIANVTMGDSSISGSGGFSVNRSEFFIRISKDNTVIAPGEKATFIIELVPHAKGLDQSALASLAGSRKIKATLYTRTFTGISGEGDRDSVDSAKAFTDAGGKARLEFQVKQKGHYILKVSSEDREGRETATETAFWASAEADSLDVPYKNLALKVSKDVYRIGETAEILIMTPAGGGTLFITSEGDRIYDYKIAKLTGNTYKFRTTVRPEMTPNFTVSVNQFYNNTVYQSQVKIVAPPVDRFIDVSLKPGKEEYRPGEEASITVQTLDDRKKGVPAEVSVAVVDEAVYQIMENSTPAITTFFYQPRQNNVTTTFFNTYRFFGYSEFKRFQLALQGKGNPALAVLKDEDSLVRDKFKDTCFWNAKVMTDRNGKAVVRFPLAENITTWRITAVAVTADSKVGQGRTTFIARKKMMILPGFPSYMIKGDSHMVSANVSNITSGEIRVDVAASVEGGTIRGTTSSAIVIGPGKTEKAYFQIIPSTDESIEKCVIRFKAKGSGYEDQIESKIPVRHFGMKDMVPAYFYMKDDGESTTTLVMPQKFISPQLVLRFSCGDGEALRQSLDYLVDYPYGCIEQTMSRFMPVLAASEAGYSPRDRKWDLQAMMKKGLLLIAQNQRNDGGFSWFGDRTSDLLMTAYVYRGLAICIKRYKCSESYMMNRARWYLYDSLEKETLTDFERVYILLSLSEGVKVEKSMVDGMISRYRHMPLHARALLVQLLYNTGYGSQAEKYFQEVLDSSGFMNDSKMFFGPDDSWENDRVETAASLLVSAVHLPINPKIQDRLALLLVMNRRGTAWKNSRDTSMAVLALSEYLKNQVENSGPSLVRISVNGAQVSEINVSPALSGEGQSVFRFTNASFAPGNNTISVSKKGGTTLHISAMVEHINRSDHFAGRNQGIDLKRTYYRIDAARDGDTMKISKDKTSGFNPGDLVMVELNVERKVKNSRYVMVTDPIPSGFSFVMRDGEYYSGDIIKEYMQRMAYDDRAVFFFNQDGDETTIRYFLRAEIPGNYRCLPSSACLMYYPDIMGSTMDSAVTIQQGEAR